jgi:SAM-dependent methyltransferase
MTTRLSDQYFRQESWRYWDDLFAVLPLTSGQRVLDLGCGVGSVTARLRELGADVVGVDLNDELLAAARTRFPGVPFICADLASLDPAAVGLVDGIWASYVAAYFTDLTTVLERWRGLLKPGGWIALTEMDNLLGHEPFPEAFRDDKEALYADARAAGRYDYRCGAGLADSLRGAGLEILHQGTLPDAELCFEGPASADVLQAWRDRLERMGGLKDLLGTRFGEFETAFLATLSGTSHRSLSRVRYVIAVRPLLGKS